MASPPSLPPDGVGAKGGLGMSNKTLNSNDFKFDLVLRIDARNCRQLVVRIAAGLGALAVVAAKFVGWLTAISG